jgi:hypothetical protein
MRLAHPGWPAFVKIFHIAAIMITATSNPTIKPAGCRRPTDVARFARETAELAEKLTMMKSWHFSLTDRKMPASRIDQAIPVTLADFKLKCSICSLIS